MAVTEVRRRPRKNMTQGDQPPMADSIGWYGWAALFLMAVSAYFLVTAF